MPVADYEQLQAAGNRNFWCSGRLDTQPVKYRG